MNGQLLNKSAQNLLDFEKVYFILLLFFCVPQLYLWGSPLLGEIFAYVTVC